MKQRCEQTIYTFLQIIASLNRLNQHAEKRRGIDVDQTAFAIEADEDLRLLREASVRTPTTPCSQPKQDRALLEKFEAISAEDNFDSFVASFRNNLNSKQLESALLATTGEQFQQLKESSMEILLPLMATWLSSSSLVHVNFALVCHCWVSAILILRAGIFVRGSQILSRHLPSDKESPASQEVL